MTLQELLDVATREHDDARDRVATVKKLVAARWEGSSTLARAEYQLYQAWRRLQLVESQAAVFPEDPSRDYGDRNRA